MQTTFGSEPHYITNVESLYDLDVEAMVRKIMREMAISKSGSDPIEPSTKKEEVVSLSTVVENKNATDAKKSRSRSKLESRKMRKSKKPSSTKDKEKKSKAKSNKKKINLIETLLRDLEQDQSSDSFGPKDEHPIPHRVIMENRDNLSDLTDAYSPSDDDSTTCSSQTSVTDGISTSFSPTASVGTKEFYNDVVSKLRPHHNSICIQESFEFDEPLAGNYNTTDSSNVESVEDDDIDFQAVFGPNDMRCLALVSHNEMKSTMKGFVIHYKNILKKFRLTGTQSTMKMLAEVFADEPDIVFGPSCNSGPLGGDAELVALMTSGNLGGILFFQDPMSSHPHQCDIECLVRQAQVHNIVMANTPTTALTIMEVFWMALEGDGKPELLPSFFFSLQSPTVEAYKNSQKKVVRSRSCVKFC